MIHADVLLVDDDPGVRATLAEMLRSTGWRITEAPSLGEGLAAALREPFDLVFLDVWLPDGCGLDAIARFRESPGRPEVLIMTGVADPSGAAMALEHGAWDYLCKPLSSDDVRLAATRVLNYRLSLGQPPKVFHIPGLVAGSRTMTACLQAAARAAATDIPVLIVGETGTGKELIARGIHAQSVRAGKPFVVLDCTVIPEHLVESHLFGHEKGAFTGADKKRPGVVKLADGGTLFLDEVGDLPSDVQAKLLRVLQEKTFRALGASEEDRSDFRVIAATHRDLETLVREGRFRHDLYYRLTGLVVHVPPLRCRKDDILAIVLDRLRRETEHSGGELKGLSPDFVETALEYSWPGNVRELLHAVAHAVAVSGDSPTLFAAHLPRNVRAQVTMARVSRAQAEAGKAHASMGPEKPSSDDEIPESLLDGEVFPDYKSYRQELLSHADRCYLQRLMERAGGDMAKACALSGLSRSRLYALLKESGPPSFRSSA
ncbi:sigma-54-dependent transcriptional regulator [Desulfosoma sp.]